MFPGQHELIWIGAVMTCFPVFFAVIENDLRKVLAYSTNNQIGFMICAIGVGTPLALNGAVAHAFADILYHAGFATPIRTPRGEDIMAACGQLKSATERARKSKAEIAAEAGLA